MINNLHPVVVGRVSGLSSPPPAHTPVECDPERPVRSLHLNESPLGPSAKAIESMGAAITNLNRYPDHNGESLVRRLAEHTGWDADKIVIGAGSNELLYASADITLDVGDEAVAPVPGFPTYAKTINLRGGRYIGVPVAVDGSVDVDAVLKAVTSRTKLVFVASPHNPTGGILDKDGIERLVAGVPDTALLHFDEAYYEFGVHAGGANTLPLLAKRNGPWIATRSFSKAYGLAGVRLGYGLCSSLDLADAYRRIRINFSVNAIALAGALAAVDDKDHLNHLLDTVAEGRKILTGALAKIGFVALPSAANFQSFILPVDAGDVVARLKAANIHVIAFPWIDGRTAVRITVGSPEDNAAVIDALVGGETSWK